MRLDAAEVGEQAAARRDRSRGEGRELVGRGLDERPAERVADGRPATMPIPSPRTPRSTVPGGATVSSSVEPTTVVGANTGRRAQQRGERDRLRARRAARTPAPSSEQHRQAGGRRPGHGARRTRARPRGCPPRAPRAARRRWPPSHVGRERGHRDLHDPDRRPKTASTANTVRMPGATSGPSQPASWRSPRQRFEGPVVVNPRAERRRRGPHRRITATGWRAECDDQRDRRGVPSPPRPRTPPRPARRRSPVVRRRPRARSTASASPPATAGASAPPASASSASTPRGRARAGAAMTSTISAGQMADRRHAKDPRLAVAIHQAALHERADGVREAERSRDPPRGGERPRRLVREQQDREAEHPDRHRPERRQHERGAHAPGSGQPRYRGPRGVLEVAAARRSPARSDRCGRSRPRSGSRAAVGRQVRHAGGDVDRSPGPISAWCWRLRPAELAVAGDHEDRRLVVFMQVRAGARSGRHREAMQAERRGTGGLGRDAGAVGQALQAGEGVAGPDDGARAKSLHAPLDTRRARLIPGRRCG